MSTDLHPTAQGGPLVGPHFGTYEAWAKYTAALGDLKALLWSEHLQLSRSGQLVEQRQALDVWLVENAKSPVGSSIFV